jgi:hypothetical protein
VDGLVQVDGRRLAVHCAGSGHPTAVVLHGWIDEPGVTSFDYYGALTNNLQGGFRICRGRSPPHPCDVTEKAQVDDAVPSFLRSSIRSGNTTA